MLQKLIEDCKRQDRLAQKKLYLHYADKLMNISLRYARDVHEAKDILQSAFIKIFTKISDFTIGEGSFEGWMSRIVVNEALQLYRKNKKIFYGETEIYDLSLTIEASAVQDLEAEDILNLLKQLPDGYRVVFNLSVVEGYNHKEIGEILGITESASRSQLARAKKSLEEYFGSKKNIDNIIKYGTAF